MSASNFEAKVNIASINTSNKTRDNHLNAPDYFYIIKHPEIILKSDNISISENKYLLNGTLTIKDVSKKETIYLTLKMMFLLVNVLFTQMIIIFIKERIERKVK